jgi:hypothetical protein
MTDNLEQRIKHTLEMAKHKVFVEGYDDIIRELLGVIDGLHEALETTGTIKPFGSEGKAVTFYPNKTVLEALTLSAPLQGWKEWGV